MRKILKPGTPTYLPTSSGKMVKIYQIRFINDYKYFVNKKQVVTINAIRDAIANNQSLEMLVFDSEGTFVRGYELDYNSCEWEMFFDEEMN